MEQESLGMGNHVQKDRAMIEEFLKLETAMLQKLNRVGIGNYCSTNHSIGMFIGLQMAISQLNPPQNTQPV